MSYNVWLTCPMCHDKEHESWNYTFNISPMLYDDAVGINIREWQDCLARKIVPELEKGITALEADPERFRAMNPENGWGSYDSLLEKFLRPILAAFKEHPNLVVAVSM